MSETLLSPEQGSDSDSKSLTIKSKKCQIKDFEDVLRYVGGWGRFQGDQMVIFLALSFFLSYVCYSPILFLYAPDHWCSIDYLFDPNSNLTKQEMTDIAVPKEPDGAKSKCYMYNVTHRDIEVLLENPRDRMENFPVIPCQRGWEFNITDYFETITTDLNWVCGDTWKTAFTQSMFYVGGIIGTVVFGYTADNYGRKFTFLASNTIMISAGLITPYCTTFLSFCCIRIFMGLSHLTFYSVFFLLTLEYVSVEKRALVGNLSLALGITLGGIIQPWLLKYLGKWKLYHNVLYGQTLILILTPWFVKESVRWLSSKGNIKESLQILKEIAARNGRTLPEQFDSEFESMVVEQKASADQASKLTCVDLFKKPRLRKHICLMIITWMMIASMFDGHIRNISNLKYSIYTTFTISALLELPADLLAIWGLNFFGRRWSAFFSLNLSALCILSCTFALDNEKIVTTLAMFGRFFVTYAMNTGAQISFEIAPTILRGQGNAMANVFAQISQFFSPFIVYSSTHSPYLPFIILGSGSIIGGFTALLLPETANEDLPDTLEEAETFGLDQKFFYFPRGAKKCNSSQPSQKQEAHLELKI